MQFHGVQYLYNMKTLRKKLWTHFPGSTKNMHLTPWLFIWIAMLSGYWSTAIINSQILSESDVYGIKLLLLFFCLIIEVDKLVVRNLLSFFYRNKMFLIYRNHCNIIWDLFWSYVFYHCLLNLGENSFKMLLSTSLYIRKKWYICNGKKKQQLIVSKSYDDKLSHSTRGKYKLNEEM